MSPLTDRRVRGAPLFLLSLAAFAACAAGPTPPGSADTDTDASASGANTSESSGPMDSIDVTTTEDGPETDAPTDDTPSEHDDAMAFLERIPGLWVGPVESQTSAGDFLTMNMDVRSADPQTLFSRVDLDSGNALRFAFAFEDHDGEPTLVFRNGGLFQGFSRDTRTYLSDADPGAGRFTFCAFAGGCNYVEATFSFGSNDGSLVVETDVLMRKHFTWTATRAEDREITLPNPDMPGSLDDPFPPMPTLHANIQWTETLEDDANVWLILTTQACATQPGACRPSRFISGVAGAGTGSTQLTIEQLHPGTYYVNAILNRDGNLGSDGLLPRPGDVVAIPDQAIEIAPDGPNELTVKLVVAL